MQYSLVLYILILLGFFNGLIVSLFILLRVRSTTFLKITALAVFLFSLTILREFLYVFGDDIEWNGLIENFFHFKLLVVGIIIIAYDSSLKPTKSSYFLLPGIIEFLLLSAIALEWVTLPKVIEDSAYIAVDCLAFFWILHNYNRHKRPEKEQRLKLKFLHLFMIGFGLIFFTRVIQLLAVLLTSNQLYEFHFFLRIFAIGLIIYATSISLVLTYFKSSKKRKSNNNTVKPKNHTLLDTIRKDKRYLSQNITLEKLASFYEIDSKTLSATIREHQDSNFNDFLNSLRLDHFISLIENSEHKQFTLLALAEKSGFSSKATFNRAFKKRYYLSPTSYIKENY